MIRRIYVCITHNKSWRIGQYFIVDEDREYFLPAHPVQSGQGKFRLEPDSMIELRFDSSIKPFVREVGQYTGPESESDDSEYDSPIFTGLN